MPEGPEVRRYADLLAANLEEQTLTQLWTRLKIAKAWLAERETEIIGQKILKIRSHGKHLLCRASGNFYFHSHLMMWGKWLVFATAPEEFDRRERARIVTPAATAVLFSAPIFALGQGDPYEQIPILNELGKDVLPYTGDFDREDFIQRLFAPENLPETIGAALLNQRIVAGIGNYLRAEILFNCRINPWREVGELTTKEIECLTYTIPHFAVLAYKTGGRTVTDAERDRLSTEPGLAYRPGTDWGARHYVFRRTNLPCLMCGEKIRQKRQITYTDDEREKTRIIYFCPNCQNVN
ncbi:MAG TPA: DNA-formamidopyrimidine glycosylase family protein [Pyrinomonadaceae bacterium]|jgi:formamidopyrimidine-DNA glycosylase